MQKRIPKGDQGVKIYSFDGKKRIGDNFDDDYSPLRLGQKFIPNQEETEAPSEENEDTEEKPIEN